MAPAWTGTPTRASHRGPVVHAWAASSRARWPVSGSVGTPEKEPVRCCPGHRGSFLPSSRVRFRRRSCGERIASGFITLAASVSPASRSSLGSSTSTALHRRRPDAELGAAVMIGRRRSWPIRQALRDGLLVRGGHIDCDGCNAVALLLADEVRRSVARGVSARSSPWPPRRPSPCRDRARPSGSDRRLFDRENSSTHDTREALPPIWVETRLPNTTNDPADGYSRPCREYSSPT